MTLKRNLLATSVGACFILWANSSYAAIVVNAPNAGQLLQEQQKTDQNKLPQPAVTVESATDSSLPYSADVKIPVQKIEISGNSLFTDEQLHPLVSAAEGKALTFNQLWQLAQKITQYYQEHGYPYSRAYLPQQNLSHGVVQIKILEAYYDKTVINNQSRTQNWLLEQMVEPLKQGERINSNQLQQQLKLINRLDGVSTRNVLSSGELLGSSQLNVDVQNTSMLGGYIGVDNFGNEYTNRARATAGISAYNLAGLGDELSFDFMTSGSRMNYGKVGYAFTFTGMGTRVGASYSYLSYELGKNLKDLGAEGSAAQTSVFISQPALLTNNAEVLLTLQYDHEQLEDDINLSQYYKHRNLDVLTARVDGSQFDQFLGGGLTQYGASTSFGRVKFKNEVAEILDTQTANTAGDYYLTSLNLSRLQNLGTKGTQAYVGIYGQYSPYNLDSAEQYLGGGPFNVRGYESSQLAGSSGYLATLELRQRLFATARNQINGKVFVDTAEIILNADKWLGNSGDNQVQMSSAGFGLNWISAWNIQANADIAFPFGGESEQLRNTDDYQYWLSIRKQF
ncbi:ShlB/FhaC/HecB family hemolysin secretion/activation protein [Acinetobacter kanungonis]|uniref:ShlB/FhaC/HecB family hemolysin secretion/activation protein n=1 Tax=Acinetobacter kanungonis TaxID=2699469 RepID=UPI00137B6DAE|nr:ShlB/FhaC/HecB family hemolysin secretion/activation protein [Acinetobacter kanungonis]NCI79812.1 ShlB/FhaC/HecB family hemolysin secretion/activation protein [Acinetobacter kanungonis]